MKVTRCYSAWALRLCCTFCMVFLILLNQRLDVKAATSLSVSFGTSGNTISKSDGKTIVSENWWNYTPSYYSVSGNNQLVVVGNSNSSYALTVYYYDTSQNYLGYDTFNVQGTITKDFKYSDAKYVRFGLPHGASGSFKVSVQYAAPASTPTPTPTPITYNLRDVSWYLGSLDSINGLISTDYEEDRVSNKIDISSSKSMKFKNSGSESLRIYVAFYTTDGRYCTGYMKDIASSGEYEYDISSLSYGQKYCIVGTKQVNTSSLTIHTDNVFEDDQSSPVDTPTPTPVPTPDPTPVPTPTPSSSPSTPGVSPGSSITSEVKLEWIQDVAIDGTGQEYVDDVSCTTRFIALLEGAEYTVGIKHTSYENGLCVYYYDENFNYVGDETPWSNRTGEQSYVLNIPSSALYMRILSRSVDDSDEVQRAIYMKVYAQYKYDVPQTTPDSGSESSGLLQEIKNKIDANNKINEQIHQDISEGNSLKAEEIVVQKEQSKTQKSILDKIIDLMNGYDDTTQSDAADNFNTESDKLTQLEDQLNDQSHGFVSDYTTTGFNTGVLTTLSSSLIFVTTWFANFWNMGGIFTAGLNLCFSLSIVFFILRLRR